MLVLVLGHRRGITLALEKREIPYIIWSPKKVKARLKAKKVIQADYPSSKEDLEKKIKSKALITHVIAGTEDSVIPSSQIRVWLNSRRNPHTIVIRCADKLKMKEYLKAELIPMTDFVPGRKELRAKKLFQQLGVPIVLKPRKSSGGRGLKFIKSEAELLKEISDQVILEKNIEGSEGSVESFIVDGKILFTNITEYYQLGHCNLVPAHYETSLKKKILKLNQQVIESMKIQWGMTHMEFYLKKKQILFGEIALRPPGGYIMEVLQMAYGKNFWDLFVQVELGLIFKEPIKLTKHTASVIIHPPSGLVKSITGLKDLEQINSLKKFKLKLKEGQKIPKREGVGQDFGYAFFANDNPSALIEDILKFQKTLKIQII
jgi:predicted ATP-grasp superfamily ATP-dependent carboligase